MTQSFKHNAHSLYDFFAQGNRGFYIPYYQRNYSWNEENAKKLIEDIFLSINRTLTKPNSSIFLGTIILHKEDNIKTGVHCDTQNLIDTVANVVDGQQRITSIAMLVCVIKEQIEQIVPNLKARAGSAEEFDKLATELLDQLPPLSRFYSVEITKTNVQPPLKPKIIRAYDASKNPVSDQWTLSGDINRFYRSPTSIFFSKFIKGTSINLISTDERVQSVIEIFTEKISEQINTANADLASGLLSANTETGGSLFNFLTHPPIWANIHALQPDDQAVYCGGMLLLAVCSFLKNSCHLVVIECPDLDLAFDMFQSLNATGTPLTAFEVFKPQMVKAWGTAGYVATIKPQVDRIDKVFDPEEAEDDSSNKSWNKGEITDKVIVSSALVFNGLHRSPRFSEERDWLKDTFEGTFSEGSPTQESINFVTCVADQADYFFNFIKPRKSQKNSQSFSLVGYLVTMGLTTQQADRTALCVFYLKDARNDLAHAVLSVFYSKLLRSQSNTTAKIAAAAEFVSVAEATAAFFTLYMGALHSRFPDSDYRVLFQSTVKNISFKNGAANQTAVFVKTVYRTALANQKIYDAIDPVVGRKMWVDLAKENAWYSRKAVCRFALFVSAHDAEPDLMQGNEGLFTSGRPNSADLLSCRVWHMSDYEVIEHIATREQPFQIKFPLYFDATIYPGNFSIVDKLGNLTLLSVKVNSSIYSEWPDKVFYYSSLTRPSLTVTGSAGTALAEKLGISCIPPALTTLAAGSNYLPQLAPLAFRGQEGHKWDATFIAKRSEHLCQRIFDKLDAWLR